jgi:hypothetical protein
MHPLTRCLAAFLISSAVLTPAVAEPADLETLAASPQNYLDKEVEIMGHCVKGGVKGDVVGYECTTEGPVYVTVDEIEPDSAKQQIDENCDGANAGDDNDSCRATVRFMPHSYTTSGVIEPGKDITVFNAEKAELTF